MAIEIDDDQIEIIQEFITESRDMIEQLEPQIIELGENSDSEVMNAIFRLFHSMKGSAGFLEFDHMTRVAHAAENLLDLIRNGEITLVPDHVNLLCLACDFAKEALDTVESNYNDDEMVSAADVMAEQLHQAIELAKNGGEEEEDAPAIDQTVEVGLAAELPQLEINDEMRQSFVTEGIELLQNAEQGMLTWGEKEHDPEALADLFRNMHSFKGNCGFFGFSEMEKLAHQMETVLDRAKSGSPLAADNPADTLLAALDLLQTAVAEISEDREATIPNLEDHLADLQKLLPPMLGEILVEEGVEVKHVTAAVETQNKPVGEILIDQGIASTEQVSAALKKQQTAQKQQKQEAKAPAKRSVTIKKQDIRVDLGKLDNLINLIGEMVIAENMLINNPDLKGMELENFNKAGQHMSKLVRELQEMAMTIRMIPVAGLFRRMIRLVHDISSKAGKKVELVLIGEETEIDKTVIETITDPLVHLLRNSLDHGLEPPDERVAAGKDEKGTVTLCARHEEGEVWVTVKDNGRGLNRDKIVEKAISKGMIDGDGSDLSDKEIYN
ncbi:MAG: Hpt domain-containing protein, partial [Geopsychrobacter sp.]|nr:Hpt domain-containing protein [Geopsychrobacter sp.]